MGKMIAIVSMLILMGGGCQQSASLPEGEEERQQQIPVAEEVEKVLELLAVLPVDTFNLTYKGFGEYIEDRFNGYHVAIDLEAEGEDVPVYAMADGEIVYRDSVSGYGGVVLVRHDVFDEPLTAIYGHIDISSVEGEVGDRVERGQQIAVLGEGGTQETDGERTHLHFAVYEGEEIRLQGYEAEASAVDAWLNPYDVLIEYAGLERVSEPLDGLVFSGRNTYPIEFDLPAGWDVEWVPSLSAMNLYTLSGEGTARERSQTLIRHFDASAFLTLSSVTIHSTEDLEVGQGYVARRYDIKKKSGVANFAGQPSWRNNRHIVTDFRGAEGYTRYYVVAANPELDEQVYEDFLASIRISE